MTTRRQFVAGAMAGVAAGALIGMNGRANAQAGIQIRISTAAPPSDFLAKALEQLKADVEATKAGNLLVCVGSQCQACKGDKTCEGECAKTKCKADFENCLK